MVAYGGVARTVAGTPTYPTYPDFQRQALEHFDALHGFALHLMRNLPESDDLVQETYLRAFRFSHRFQPGTHLRAWLFQILRNTFLTFYRLREREAAHAENGIPDMDTPMFQDAPVNDAYAMETYADLERAMRKLPEELRTIVLLAEVEGLPLEEVARVMGCPVGTVKSRIFRARERLRGLLGDYRSTRLTTYSSEDVRHLNGTALNGVSYENGKPSKGTGNGYIGNGHHTLTVLVDQQLFEELTRRPLLEAGARASALVTKETIDTLIQ